MTLRIKMFRGCYISKDGASVNGIDTVRLQAFLCYLLIYARQPQTRHHIAAVLWPDSTESQARTNLRKYIHRLRHILPDTDKLFYIDTNTIQWRADNPVIVDIHTFERCAETEDISTLKQAVDLYQGDLLPGCYEDWIISPRERLANQYMQALERLTRLLEVEANYNEAITYAQKLLGYDPLRESSYRRLMDLYALAGNRTAAIATYYQCVDMLKQEMDLVPDEGTQQLFEQIRGSVQVSKLQRQQMTVLMVDIADFSDLVDRFDMDALYDRLNAYMGLLERIVISSEGDVIKRMGDGLFATFTRATDGLQAAYRLQNALCEFNRAEAIQFHIRTGITTGEIHIVDAGGSQESELMGHPINIVAKLQAITPIDGITLDEATYTACTAILTDDITQTQLTTRTDKHKVYILTT